MYTQKSNPSLRKEVGKNIKDKKKGQKREGTEFRLGKGVLKREKFPNTRKHSLLSLCRALEAQRATYQGGKINKQLKPTDYEPNGNSPSEEAAQTPALASGGWAGRRGLH